MRWMRLRAQQGAADGIVEGDQAIEVEGDPLNGYTRTANRRPLASVEYLENLVDNDRVEAEITGIGVLANRFVREKTGSAA